jgi:hypothetical protein
VRRGTWGSALARSAEARREPMRARQGGGNASRPSARAAEARSGPENKVRTFTCLRSSITLSAQREQRTAIQGG